MARPRLLRRLRGAIGQDLDSRPRHPFLGDRTADEILARTIAFAIGVIEGAPVLDLDGEQDTVAGYHSTFTGPAPKAGAGVGRLGFEGRCGSPIAIGFAR